MPFSGFLILYMLMALLGAITLLLLEWLWFNSHNWHLSRSKLLTCKKCGNVFQLPRQSVDRRCPACGGRTQPFQMPYSGIHETLKQRARHLKEN